MSLRRRLPFLFAAVIACLCFGWAGTAGALDSPGYTAPPPSTPVTTPPQGEQVQRAFGGPQSVTQVEAASASQSLPITGSDTMQLVAIGGALLLGGAVLLGVRRRAHTAA